MSFRRQIDVPLTILLCLAIVGIWYTVQVRHSRLRSAASINNEAMRHMDAGDPRMGIALLKEAVVAEPDLAAAHFNLAMACSSYRKDAVEVLGIDYRTLYSLILTEMDKACDLMPLDIEFVTARALTHLDWKAYYAEPDWEAARKAWMECLAAQKARLRGQEPKILEKNKMLPVLHTLATIALEMNDPERAHSYYEMAVRLMPNQIKPENWVTVTSSSITTAPAGL